MGLFCCWCWCWCGESVLSLLKVRPGQLPESVRTRKLTAAQRASAIKRRKQIWEALHPNSGNSFSTIPTDEPRGRGRPPEFASETAAAAGMTKQAINQHLSRADALVQKPCSGGYMVATCPGKRKTPLGFM